MTDEFKLIAMTITEINTRHSDGLDADPNAVHAAKRFDGHNPQASIASLMGGVETHEVDVMSTPGADDIVTFVGTHSKTVSLADPGDSLVKSKMVTVVAKKV